MVVKKLNNINPEVLPKEVKENLNLLIKPKPEIVVIGRNYYELHPIPAIKFLEILRDLFNLVDKLKEKKRKVLSILANDESITKENKNVDIKNIQITFTDILEDEEAYNELINLLKTKILEGVDEEDFNQMTAPQLIYLMNKIIQVNLNNIPPALSKNIFGADKQNFLQTLTSNQNNQQ